MLLSYLRSVSHISSAVCLHMGYIILVKDKGSYHLQMELEINLRELEFDQPCALQFAELAIYFISN